LVDNVKAYTFATPTTTRLSKERERKKTLKIFGGKSKGYYLCNPNEKRDSS